MKLAETTTTPFSAPAIVQEQDVTTRFADETEAQGLEIASASLTPGVWQSAHDYGVETIKDFLGKPSLLYNGVFQTTDVAGTVLDTRLLPGELLLRLKQTTKLNGAYMYRADIEVTLKVNATRFQQGRYFMRVVYSGGASTSVSTTKLLGAHMANLVTQTSANMYEIDLATQTSLTFTIPFISAANYCMVNSASTLNHDFCKLYLVPYSPLQAGSGDTTCQYAVWARLINVSISGSVVLQSKSVTFQESKKAGVGPVSAVAAKVARSASILGEVPLLSTAATAVSWIADLTRRVALIWGYSKPPIVAPSVPMVRQALPSAALSDGANQAHKLSLFSGNEVPITTGRSGTSVDELSFDYLCANPAWISTVVWDDTMTAGTILKAMPVGLGANMDPVTVNIGRTVPPCDYVAALFGAYRANVKYKLKLPKTEFHSGRLAVCWQPANGYAAPPTISTIYDTDNLQRLIWDIRESNELEIEIPWVSLVNFHQVDIGYAVFYIMVINELIAPSTVPSSVNILIEKSATGVEFGMPISPSTAGASYQPFIQYQSKPVVLGVKQHDVSVVAESFGEVVRSARSLLKRFSPVTSFTTATANSIVCNAFEFPIVGQITGAGGAASRVSTYTDYLTYFAPLFTFSTGGVRVALGAGSGNSLVTPIVSKAASTSTFFTTLSNTTAQYEALAPVVPVSIPVEGFCSVEIPQMTYYGARSISNILSGVAGVYSSQPAASHGGNNVSVIFRYPSTIDFAVTPVTVYRSAADDFSFSRYNGVTPLILSTQA